MNGLTQKELHFDFKYKYKTADAKNLRKMRKKLEKHDQKMSLEHSFTLKAFTAFL